MKLYYRRSKYGTVDLIWSYGKRLLLLECLWNPAWWRERPLSIELHEQKGSLSNPIQILVSFSLLLTRSKEINKEMHRFAIHETFQQISHKKTLPIQKKHTKSVSCLSDSSELCRFPPQVPTGKPLGFTNPTKPGPRNCDETTLVQRLRGIWWCFCVAKLIKRCAC